MLFGFHHLHKRLRERKRLAEQQEHPHFNLKKFILDEIVYVAAIMSPVATIPQAFIIFQHKDASGVSIISWASYFFISMIWIYYGIVHKAKPVILSQHCLDFSVRSYNYWNSSLQLTPYNYKAYIQSVSK